MNDDTIVAISTPFGESGIGIVRMSGKRAFEIAEELFKRKDKRGVFDLSDHSINYGWIFDPGNNAVIDEVLLSVLKSPKTYTREDMIEINCHGGWVTLNKIMDLIVNYGARIALPGEFTKRAFLNGRIDLTQAEAVLDIIRAKSENGLSNAIKRLQGGLKNKLDPIRDNIVKLLCLTEARIDFDNQITDDGDKDDHWLDSIIKETEALLQGYERARGEREGIKTVICGKANVGKSSIINAIYGEERVLTSNIPGTTRDSIKINIFLDGMIYNLIDTAGIKKGRTIIEKLSIKNSEKEINNSDCLLMVFDLSRRISCQDERIVKWIKGLGKEIIWTANKKDLPKKIDIKVLKKLIGDQKIFEISAKEGSGIERIISELKRRNGKLSKVIMDEIIVNKRQKVYLESVKALITQVKIRKEDGFQEELISEDLRNALDELDKITGKSDNGEIIESIFEDFCIGK
ncbi:MAG: tRNA uridine-5-carboxymethylaminomethyl(34) synthesis GTPase MnmE [bacterium]